MSSIWTYWNIFARRKIPHTSSIQIAYYTGLRIEEVCGLTWQDINLEEQYLTVRRSLRYNGARHKHEIGTTKRKKVRIVDFCDTLTEILKKTKREQHRQRFQYGELYHRNYYKQVTDKGRNKGKQTVFPVRFAYPDRQGTSSIFSQRARKGLIFKALQERKQTG